MLPVDNYCKSGNFHVRKLSLEKYSCIKFFIAQLCLRKFSYNEIFATCEDKTREVLCIRSEYTLYLIIRRLHYLGSARDSHCIYSWLLCIERGLARLVLEKR